MPGKMPAGLAKFLKKKKMTKKPATKTAAAAKAKKPMKMRGGGMVKKPKM
tara:strand:- start:1981 stop:2130 length:150 start_codon:yes stop_codon:yes gene_type:complete